MLKMRMRERAGFTAIDFLAVVFIVVVILGLALPLFVKARKADALMTTKEYMRECATAVNRAHDQNKTIPPYFGIYGGWKEPLTFHAHLWPFLREMGGIYDENPITGNAVVPLYLSGLDPTRTNDGAGAANYAVNLRLSFDKGGTGVLSSPENPIKLKWGQVQDGTSNTLLFATKYQVCGANGGSMWLDPGNNALQSPLAATFGASMDHFQKAPTQAACHPTAGTAVSFNRDELIVVFCDASVNVVKAGVSPAIWISLHTYAAGDNPYYDGAPD
ncbi:MAG TPA: type II secretion system protein [Gemmataceae bacterium]|nr:type II secretion system protein [Gemmataceae bacterium]